jgi:hypothetical protein
MIGVLFANIGRCIDTKVLPRLLVLARLAIVVQRNWQVKFPNQNQPKDLQQGSSVGITVYVNDRDVAYNTNYSKKKLFSLNSSVMDDNYDTYKTANIEIIRSNFFNA